jgi:hypothetical protein
VLHEYIPEQAIAPKAFTHPLTNCIPDRLRLQVYAKNLGNPRTLLLRTQAVVPRLR